MSTFEDMKSLIKTARLARDQIVVCLEGPAGIGKTAACREVAEECGCKLVTIIASQILPNEVSGITMPVHETKAMEIYDHFRLSSLRDGDILFFDELLEADQLVLSACLTLIESRELMSGRKLPDVQIVAATNATIKPQMLKENIRQRFVWRHFDIDKQGCREYIKKTTGLDVGDLVDNLETTRNEYNILTPRSLTKMAQWISKASDKEEARAIAKAMNACWNNSIGSKLYSAYDKMISDPMVQVRNAINKTLEDANVDVDIDFENSSIAEVMEMLKTLPEWEQIQAKLAAMEMEDDDELEIISF